LFDNESESDGETYSNCDECERKHDLEFLDNLEMSINLAVSNKLVYDCIFLKGYNDKFVDHMYNLLKGTIVERIKVGNTLDVNLLELKPRFKPFHRNILLFK